MSPTISSSSTPRHIITVPYPGRGHINPLMNLAKLLSTKDPQIHFTFILTEEWLRLISTEQTPANITFKTIPNVLPSETIRGADMRSFIEAVMTKMESPVELVLDQLQIPVTAIIADSFLWWMIGVARRRNFPVASFWPMSATVLSLFHHAHLFKQRLGSPSEHRLTNIIPGIPSIRLADLPDVFLPKNEDLLARVFQTVSAIPDSDYLIIRSINELEEPVITTLKEGISIPVYAIGPPAIPFSKSHHIEEQPNYLQWLDGQPRSSVLYVSFGSFISISSVQMDELLMGLLESGVPYLWVVRGEESRLEENGMMVPWCDQLKVLSHSSVGGFLSHCGLSSTLESVLSGVPVLTFPLAMDQYPNSKQVVEDWEVGWRLKRSHAGSEDVVKGEEIGGIVRRFMDLGSDERRVLDANCKSLQMKCLGTVGKGGSADTNLDVLLKCI